PAGSASQGLSSVWSAEPPRPRAEHPIGVAVAAVARQPPRRLDPAEGLAIVRIHQQRAGREQNRLGEIRARAYAQIALSGRTAVVRPSAIAAEALAGEGLIHHAEDRFA